MVGLVKRTLPLVVVLMVVFSSLASAQSTSTTRVEAEKNEKVAQNDDVVFLNGEPVKNNDVILATPENQDLLIKKYGLTKPSENAKLVSLRIVLNPNDLAQSNLNSANSSSQQLALGLRLVADPPQFVDGWTEIARGKYFCNRPTTDKCTGIQVEVQANSAVSTEINATFGASYNDFVSAEFGFSEGETVGVSTTVVTQAPDIPGGRTYIAVGYPIYKSTFFELWDDGIFSSKKIGTGTFLAPQPSSIAVTDWIQ